MTKAVPSAQFQTTPPSPPGEGGRGGEAAGLIIPSLHNAPIPLYAHLLAYGSAIEDRGEHFVKQTWRNRCLIATPLGPQALTVPIERTGRTHTPMRDIRISDHGGWQRIHWTALTSAYENSPYFEFCADDYAPLYEHTPRYLVDFNEALMRVTLELLGIEANIEVSEEYIKASPSLSQSLSPPAPLSGGRGGSSYPLNAGDASGECAHFIDLRGSDFTSSKTNHSPLSPRRGGAGGRGCSPYYQVFAPRTGFLPNLSILDLLFNMGPESRLVLRATLNNCRKSKP